VESALISAAHALGIYALGESLHAHAGALAWNEAVTADAWAFARSVWSGQPLALAVAVLLDLALGDPVYRAHPVRLMGTTLSAFEQGLRRIGADGYGGGIALFVLLAGVWVGGISGIIYAAAIVAPSLAWACHVYFLYSLLALGDLLRHVWRVERAANREDVDEARRAIACLVGRDTDRMDTAACRRAAVESLSESLTDGFTSALFWYALLGLPGLVLFKVVSTMDSMVGYKTPRYLRFGWCGARLDDVMNYVPARLTWLLLAAIATVVPGCSARKALTIGLRQHAALPGPNSGWSEAATAGGIQRRLIGPIWRQGQLITDIWIGDPADPPLSTHNDVTRALTLVATTGLTAATLAGIALFITR
jgi:adenosylcobinamide-phosphate synthase